MLYFFNDQDVRYKRELAWLQAIWAQLQAIKHHFGDLCALCVRGDLELRLVYVRAFSAARKTKALNRGYRILHSFADYNCLMEARASEYGFLHTSSSFPEETVEELQLFVQGMFPRERAAVTAKERSVWSSIISKGDKSIYRKDRKEGKARYASTSNVLVGHMEEKENGWTARWSTGLLVGIAGVFDGLGCLHPVQYVHPM